MGILSRMRSRGFLGLLAPSCVALVGLGSACNALVGVDFGAAYLADGGLDAAPPVDVGPHHDARHTGTKDGGHGNKDATTDGPPCNAKGTPSTEPCVIAEAYGVFVAPPAAGGDDVTGSGTRAHPFATIGHAIAEAKGKRVYVCGATYPEQLSVTVSVDGIEIYGGLVCPASVAVDAGSDATTDAKDSGHADAKASGHPDAKATGHAEAGATDASSDGSVDAQVPLAPWQYGGVPATVAPATQGYALDVEDLVKGALFEDMAFDARPASATAGGSSSIAIMVNASNSVSFTRVGARAGAGLVGATPAVVSNACTTSLAGASNNGATPGTGGSCTCPIFGSSLGGTGVPTSHVAAPADTGSSTPPVTTPAGTPGTVTYNGEFDVCTPGNPGAGGAAGTPGTAGAAGSLTAFGWAVGVAGSGTPGKPGQGGGGGGSSATAGAGGGAGGCGGNGGPGAAGGGASIAVALIKSTASFASVTLQASDGGAGGAGQAGEAGESGGPGGSGQPNSILDSCSGGTGGTGGGGGGGGGGAGGPSIGIGWLGSTAPTVDGQPTPAASTLVTPSTFSGGGGGGGGAGGATPGAAGSGGAAGPAGTAGAVVAF